MLSVCDKPPCIRSDSLIGPLGQSRQPAACPRCVPIPRATRIRSGSGLGTQIVLKGRSVVRGRLRGQLVILRVAAMPSKPACGCHDDQIGLEGRDPLDRGLAGVGLSDHLVALGEFDEQLDTGADDRMIVGGGIWLLPAQSPVLRSRPFDMAPTALTRVQGAATGTCSRGGYGSWRDRSGNATRSGRTGTGEQGGRSRGQGLAGIAVSGSFWGLGEGNRLRKRVPDPIMELN